MKQYRQGIPCAFTRAFTLTMFFALALLPPAVTADVLPGDEMAELIGGKDILPRKAPPRDEGSGPYERLVIRGATVIDGTGAPPIGPADIVIEGDRITDVRLVGYPGLPIEDRRRPEGGDRELDASGMYVLPGLIDSHAHISSSQQAAYGEASPAEYVYKLWLGHGITTVREIGSSNGLGWTIDQRRKSARNEITAPRIYAYAMFPIKEYMDISVDAGVAWVQAVKDAGADGVKFLNAAPAVMEAALAEAERQGLRTAFHHAQMAVTRMDVLDTARWGLTSMEHWYGLPEALFDDRTVQDYPGDYNYANEQDRFGQAGRLWEQAAEPGSPHWNAVRDELLELDFTLVPTFTIYEASRDLMRARTAEWHEDYTWPTLWRFFQPNRAAHGSYWFYWTTADEIAWKRNYTRWMTFVNDYKNQGGRVAAGSDAGFIYKVYGFAFIRELELLQEAGFHPLEALRAATLDGAELLGAADELGTVEVGKKADLVLVEENPLENFKVLYGTGTTRLNEQNQPERVGGVRWTIKDGIIYDAKRLLRDVRDMVAAEKAREQQDG
ncbi:MAG: amidohydrolase family protein [Pseudohaliea sp.]